MNNTLEFRMISAEDFNAYFDLDSPGYYLVRDALLAGEESDALHTLECVCLANKLYAMQFDNQVAEELLPHGKAAEYLESGSQERADLAIATLGQDRMRLLAREVMDRVRQEVLAAG
jgi:hypothetical protein